MLDQNGAVELVQPFFPLLEVGRVPKPLGVVFDRLPSDEEKVASLGLTAALELMRKISGLGRDDRLSLIESGFELLLAARLYVQDGDFENHGILPQPRPRRLR